MREIALALPDVIMGPRKAFTAFSRKVQFRALRPTKTGALLGLCAPLDADPRLIARGAEGWSERLPAKLALSGLEDVDGRVEALVGRAWEGS